MKSSLKVYKAINKLSWPNSYSGKFLLISFIGIHIPLIGLIIYLLPSGSLFKEHLPIILIALISTLLGVFVTLWMLAKLLKPLTLTSKALQEYIENETLPNLPTDYTDEAGKLMANTQESILHLDELLQVKNDLLSILSHDARSPINSIILSHEMLQDEISQEPIDVESVKDYLSIIEQSAKHQLELMNNILTLARLDSGDVIVDKDHISLGKIVQRIKETNYLQLKAKNQTFNTDLGEFENKQIYVDEVKLKAVLNNLVQNATKFTAKGGTIELSAFKTNGDFKISVSDNGVGIEESKLERLFERDSTSHSKGTNQEKGSGLGLWICKVFTKLNGGSISVESDKDKGSTFILTFDKNEILVN